MKEEYEELGERERERETTEEVVTWRREIKEDRVEGREEYQVEQDFRGLEKEEKERQEEEI